MKPGALIVGLAAILAAANASANPTRIGDRLCAASIYAAIGRDHMGTKWSRDRWPNVLETIASLRRCRALREGLRHAAKRASREPEIERWHILAQYPPVDPPPACQPPAPPADRTRWGTRCIPRDPLVVLLFRREPRPVGGPETTFVAGVVDRLASHSRRLLPAAQLLWVYANLGLTIYISAACPMHSDIENGIVRLDEPYGTPTVRRRDDRVPYR